MWFQVAYVGCGFCIHTWCIHVMFYVANDVLKIARISLSPGLHRIWRTEFFWGLWCIQKLEALLSDNWRIYVFEYWHMEDSVAVSIWKFLLIVIKMLVYSCHILNSSISLFFTPCDLTNIEIKRGDNKAQLVRRKFSTFVQRDVTVEKLTCEGTTLCSCQLKMKME